MTTDDFAIPSTGIPEFDRDHERLVLLVREVRRQLQAGRRPMAVACGRQAYVLLQSHMAREEAYLQAIRYPWLEEHREGKARLRETATHFVARLSQAHIPVPGLLRDVDELAVQIHACVTMHDGRYARFINAEDVAAQ